MDSTHILHKVPELANRGKKTKAASQRVQFKKRRKERRLPFWPCSQFYFFPLPRSWWRRDEAERSEASTSGTVLVLGLLFLWLSLSDGGRQNPCGEAKVGQLSETTERGETKNAHRCHVWVERHAQRVHAGALTHTHLSSCMQGARHTLTP